MPDKNIHILSTRPLEPSLISRAAANNITIDTKSLIKTEAIRNEVLKKSIAEAVDQSTNIIFTSMNAAEAVAACLEKVLPQWNIYCLGAATKEIVTRNFPHSRISGVAENASDLADEIINDDVHKIVFFCGDQRRDELPDKLHSKNIAVREIVVYKTLATPEKIGKIYNGILFFSPSAVESFFLLNTVPEETILFSIGATTSACIRQHSNNTIIQSDRPGKKDLAEKSMHYFDKSNHTNEHVKK